ncbi:MAG: hypothetical protein ABSA11_17260 [Candidatus Bathyarchaeia archaeon]|jgi:hypothetical protein
MVDLSEIQAVYYMVAATGVLVAAAYYVMNMRASRKSQELAQKTQEQTLETRKLQFLTTTVQFLMNEEGFKTIGELLNMEWTDYDDFEKKYGSDHGLDNYAKRYYIITYYNMLGAFLREKLIDAESLYNTGPAIQFIFFWHKFKGIIERQRELYVGADYGRDLEFLSDEMMKIKLRKDPSFKVPETFMRYVPSN